MSALEQRAPLDKRLDALAQMFTERAWQDRDAMTVDELREFLRDHAASLSEFAEQARDEYARVVGDTEIPTNAQGIALAQFLRPEFRKRTGSAHVTRGTAGLSDSYLHVRLADGYEGGIDADGRVST